MVVVTGGSRGIGAAIALAAARAGADLAIGFKASDRDADAIRRQIEDLGGSCMTFRADLTEQAEAARAVHEIEKRFGAIDGLVLNAGILHSAPFLETTDADWEAVLAVDLFGAIHCLQAALPGMLARSSGSIVMVSSRIGQIGWAGLAAYSAAKAALLGLTKSLAREYGESGVRVNAVAPAVVITDMTRGLSDDDLASRRPSDFPLGRFGTAEEVAAAVVFLLSDASSLFIGQTLNPNGGGYMP